MCIRRRRVGVCLPGTDDATRASPATSPERSPPIISSTRTRHRQQPAADSPRVHSSGLGWEEDRSPSEEAPSGEAAAGGPATAPEGSGRPTRRASRHSQSQYTGPARIWSAQELEEKLILSNFTSRFLSNSFGPARARTYDGYGPPPSAGGPSRSRTLPAGEGGGRGSGRQEQPAGDLMDIVSRPWLPSPASFVARAGAYLVRLPILRR